MDKITGRADAYQMIRTLTVDYQIEPIAIEQHLDLSVPEQDHSGCIPVYAGSRERTKSIKCHLWYAPGEKGRPLDGTGTSRVQKQDH
ncbi:hypothetical protein [Pedobacter cryoconitis]|uniref:hypothetical protein n=1 Tax=Pedobacter cryoconitis TaxID=188932 RepID=UPI0008395219|nr:hypothetical protein [Pedobacter cryoconitis]